MNRQVRIISFEVHLAAVVDDGEHLTPIQVQPVTYSAADAALFDLDHVRQLLQRQVDADDLATGRGAVPVDQPVDDRAG